MSAVPPWIPHLSPSFGQRHSFGGPQFASPPPPIAYGGPSSGLRSSVPSPGSRSNFGGSNFSGRGPNSSGGSTASPPRASISSQPGIHPENLAAAYETCRDEIRVLGRELREAQQTPDAEYWKGQAQLLHSQMQSLYDFAGKDELRMHSEMRHFQGIADGEAIAARWKVAASEAEAQMIAHQTAETAIAGQEWRARKDTEWLKTRLQAAEEQRSKMTGLTEHYKGLACKQLDTIQETNAQVAAHRAKIRDDEAKMQFLENSNGWLTQKLRLIEEEESQLASLLPAAREENGQLSSRLSRTEATLSEVEARERDTIKNLEARAKSLEDDADMLRGSVWAATNSAGLAEAEMGVMSEQTVALKKKYKGFEDRRTRLAMLEEANKQLRLKMAQLKDQEKLVETLTQDKDKLKRRLKSSSQASSKAAVAAARSLEIENLELRSELLEVTKVLEQVGEIQEPVEDWRYRGEHVPRRGFSPPSRTRSQSPGSEQILSMSVPVASDSLFEFPAAAHSGRSTGAARVPSPIASPKQSPRCIASPKLASRGVSASPRRSPTSSPHLQARSESPQGSRYAELEEGSSDARLLAAMQNVTRALERAGLDRGRRSTSSRSASQKTAAGR